jgi:hypothetical protein
MPNGDDRKPEPRGGAISRRDRLMALLIVLLIAAWLGLLYVIR